MEQSLVAAITQINVVIIVAVTLLTASLGVALYRVAAGLSKGPAGTNRSKAAIEPLDVLAFNNLIDAEEENFLRENLPPATFRDIQRLRLGAAIEYVLCASRNAALLIRLGKTVSVAGAQRSQQARDLIASAVQLRLLSILVLCLLWVKMAFPGLRLSLKEVSTMHEHLVRQQASLTRLKGSDRMLEPS